MNSFIAVVLTGYIDYRNYIGQVKFEPSAKEKNVKFHVSSTAPLGLKFLPVCNGMKC